MDKLISSTSFKITLTLLTCLFPLGVIVFILLKASEYDAGIGLAYMFYLVAYGNTILAVLLLPAFLSIFLFLIGIIKKHPIRKEYFKSASVIVVVYFVFALAIYLADTFNLI